jgi:hypothetical protein
MISTSQREHLTYSLILQLAILAWLAIVTWTYILPWIKEINANEVATINTVEQFKKIKESWLTLEELWLELWNTQGKEELLKIIRASPDEARTVITKSGQGDYIDWLYQAIWESSKDRNDLKAVKMLINSILPTMSPTSSAIDEEYMTLKSYITFIEKKFLNEFNISSNIVLWVQGISYGADTWAKNVWSFELRLDFSASNDNIQRLITYVNRSWNPELLSWTGINIWPDDTDKTIRTKITTYLKAASKNSSKTNWENTDDSVLLANPLMTIESLSLENVLDARKPDDINNWRVTIRFYVRGSSQEDITFLQSYLSTRKENLNKEITSAITECKAQDLLCANLSKLEAFEKKYNEFSRSLGGTKWLQSTDIAILWQASVSLRALDEEFKNIANKTNRK